MTKKKWKTIHNDDIELRQSSFFISIVLIENPLKTVPVKNNSKTNTDGENNWVCNE